MMRRAPAIMSAPKTSKFKKIFLTSKSKSQEKEDVWKSESLPSEYAEPSSPTSPSEKKKRKRFFSLRSKKKPNFESFDSNNSGEQLDFTTRQISFD
ncbi:hypothetical protein QTP86_009277 [Hemibagrus guttatus]|nr:hypothetical protein QTP86_009277 [Hemibagrus guttatus]